MSVRQRLATTLGVVVLAAAPAAAPAVFAGSATPPTARAACTQARIGGQSKCIARGQFCARAHRRDYRRYGLSCTKRDARGNYHLQ
jgi:hypothetical protein